MCVAFSWFASNTDVVELATKSSLGISIVWTATSKYVLTSIGFSSSWVMILIRSVFVPLSSTWTIMSGDFNTSSWVSCSNLSFSDFWSLLSFFICVKKVWLWFPRRKSSSFSEFLTLSLVLFSLYFIFLICSKTFEWRFLSANFLLLFLMDSHWISS